MRRLLSLLCLLLLLVLPSCKSDSQWTFGLSRSFYDSSEKDRREWSVPPDSESMGPAMLAAMILVLPVAIDIALLPVTLPHDLFLMR